MGRYVAFLRGINVGGRATIAMAELREIIAEAGYTDASTLLNSGNAIFTAEGRQGAAAVARTLEGAIEARFGRAVPCLVRTDKELAAIIAHDPFRGVATDPARYMVTFLSAQPDPAKLAAIDPAAYLPEQFAARGREIYLWCPNGLRETAFGNVFFEKKLAVVATARNWNTVTKALAAAQR
jgi:uncharacterized protein (DUF1697 family)